MSTAAGALVWLRALADSPVPDDERWITAREARLITGEVDRLTVERDEARTATEVAWNDARAIARTLAGQRDQARAALERVRSDAYLSGLRNAVSFLVPFDQELPGFDQETCRKLITGMRGVLAAARERLDGPGQPASGSEEERG